MATTLATEALDSLTALADPTRSRIVALLARQDRCVCHLVEELDLGQSIVSHHVGVLRRSGLIDSYPHPRDRRWMYYRLNRALLRDLSTALDTLADEQGYNPERLACPIDRESEQQ